MPYPGEIPRRAAVVGWYLTVMTVFAILALR
jgi:hypothetical protein